MVTCKYKLSFLTLIKIYAKRKTTQNLFRIYPVFQGRMPTVSQVLLRQDKQERGPWRGSIGLLIWHRDSTAHSLHINQVEMRNKDEGKFLPGASLKILNILSMSFN